MSYGISIYAGLDNTLEENIQLIKNAKAVGVTRVFTAFNIHNKDFNQMKNEVEEILRICKENDMDVISDISPETIKFLGFDSLDLKELKKIGIHTVRIDYGYDEKVMAELTHNDEGIKLQLNASTINKKVLDELEKYGANFSAIDALHNFYPRKGTGISEATFLRKTRMLKDRGIEVYAFVGSNNRRKSPFYDGLPTMEAHRGMAVSLAARHLLALGTDGVFIADSLPSEQELKDLTAANPEVIELKAKLKTNDKTIIDLLNNVFTSRDDEARDAIRAQESRLIVKEKIKQENNTYRYYGDITVDNYDYGTYMGELEIIKTPQESDERVNNVGSVLKEEQFLMKYITEGRKFKFRLI